MSCQVLQHQAEMTDCEAARLTLQYLDDYEDRVSTGAA